MTVALSSRNRAASGTVTKVRIDPDEPIVDQVREVAAAESDPGASIAGLKAYIRNARDQNRLTDDVLLGLCKTFVINGIVELKGDQVRSFFHAVQAAERHDLQAYGC